MEMSITPVFHRKEEVFIKRSQDVKVFTKRAKAVVSTTHHKQINKL